MVTPFVSLEDRLFLQTKGDKRGGLRSPSYGEAGQWVKVEKRHPNSLCVYMHSSVRLQL